MRLALKLFRGEPAISGFDWLFTPNHSSSHAFSTTMWFGPPRCFTTASAWPWLDHPVSGLQQPTIRPIQTRFRSGSVISDLTLLVTVTRRTVLQKVRSQPGLKSIGLELFVSTRFQVLFHSPSGVLFTFPSRYWFTIGRQEVFSLGRWSSQFPTGFHVSRGTQVPPHAALLFAYRAFTFCGRTFQTGSTKLYSHFVGGPTTPWLSPWFGLFPFRSPLLRKSKILSLPPGT